MKQIRTLIKYLQVIIKFCQDYWQTISRAARETAALWLEVLKLATTLAARLRQARDEEQS